MTTIFAIQNDLDSLSRRALDLGLARPNFTFELKSEQAPSGVMSWRDPVTETEKYEYVHGDSAAEIIEKMQIALDTLGSKEDRERNQYLKHLAKVVEYGKKIGIDEQFINPLELQMKKLSANILIDGRSNENSDPWHANSGDEVPF